jgi:hypothetical protein
LSSLKDMPVAIPADNGLIPPCDGCDLIHEEHVTILPAIR